MHGDGVFASSRIHVTVLLAAAISATAGCGGDGDDAGGSARASTTPAPLRSLAAPPPADEGRQQDFPAMTTAAATRTARHVALVTSRGSRYVEGAPGTPFTRTDFAVKRVLKGSLPDRIVVQVIGGKLGNTTVESPVRPFVKGRRYIVFLGPPGKVGPTIIPQAVLDVRRSGSRDVVDPAPTGIPLLKAGTSKRARKSPAGPALEDVLYSIRRFARTHTRAP
jgi:hypothetical protein